MIKFQHDKVKICTSELTIALRKFKAGFAEVCWGDGRQDQYFSNIGAELDQSKQIR